MTEDELRDRRQERGGVDGNVNYRRTPKTTNNTWGKKKPSGMSAMDFVKKDIERKYGKGSIMDTSKKKEMSPEEKQKDAARRSKNWHDAQKGKDPYKSRAGESD